MLLLEALKWNKSDYVEALLDDGVQLPLQYIGTLYSTLLTYLVLFVPGGT